MVGIGFNVNIRKVFVCKRRILAEFLIKILITKTAMVAMQDSSWLFDISSQHAFYLLLKP